MIKKVNAAIARIVGTNQKIRFIANLSMQGPASSREFTPIAGATEPPVLRRLCVHARWTLWHRSFR